MRRLRDELKRCRAETDAAEHEADVQACQRRMLQEYVSEMRGTMRQAQIDVPRYPNINSYREK